MAATITSTATRITISGSYKAFDSTTGSTTTIIQYNSGEAPASGDSGRFLMWKNGLDTSDWEIRYIESATASTVTVGDGGFSSSPGSGEDFVISTDLSDVETAEPVACTSSGSSYSFNGRDLELTSEAFFGDVNKSLVMVGTSPSNFGGTYPVADNCAIQFGRLIGGESNDSTETIEGCQLAFEIIDNNSLIFTTQGAVNTAGPVLNFYGCLIESFANGFQPFIRSPGPMRLIGCICDGPMGGRLYSAGSELIDTRFSGNTNGGIAWSLGGTFTRPIDNAFFFQNDTAIKAFQAFQGVFSNTQFSDSNTNIIDSSGAQAGLLFTFIDCTTFGDAKITDTNGQYKQAKSINYTLSDSSGTGLTGAKVAVYDNTATIQDEIEESTSGLVNPINAVFFDRPDGTTSTDKSPFDIRIRKYDYQYQDFQSAVSEPIKQEFRLPDNTVTVLSEAAAGALTGIAIDFVSETLTITESHTLSELYDYTQSQMALDANMDEVEFLKSGDGNVFTFNDNWNLILNSGGDITNATGKTVVFGGTGILQLNDAGNTIDGLTVTGDIKLDALVTPLTNLTVTGALDFNAAVTYNLDGCTINEVTNSSGGSVTLNLLNGATVATNTGPDISILVTVVNSHNAENGSFGYLNLDKWTTLVGVYVDQATGEAANPAPATGDYFFIDPLMDGNRTDAVYWDGSVWVSNGSPTIIEGFILSTDLGGPGVPLNNVINVEDGTNIRRVYDKFGLYMKVDDIVATSGIFSILLESNPNVDDSKIADALPYTLQFVLQGPDEVGLMTMKVPSFDANPGDDSDPDLAAAATELARLSEGSLQGALSTNDAELAEITNIGELTLKDDTLEIIPLDSVIAGERTTVPLFLNLVNYTIEAVTTTTSH